MQRRHAQFFSSLKQVEKRLKLEDRPSPSTAPPPPPPPSPPPQNQENTINTEQTESLGSPIFLDYDYASTTANNSSFQESEVPRQFLTNSPDFPPTHDSPPQENTGGIQYLVDQTTEESLDDEIVLLMQLLGLSHCEEPNKSKGFFNIGSDDDFYRKIVGVKGPKSGKEVQRLEGWINHFLEGEKKEPLRLAHLLLGKAAVSHSDNNSDDFGGLEFPSTIDEFFQNDPPTI